MKTVATHNNGFHADDCFAVASLELLFGELNIVRTRDEAVIQSADIVVDVGRDYDEEKMRFDHHQEGGAGKRANGVPYASFGLVWKTFGEKICGSQEMADIVDRDLVAAIDGDDNGFSVYAPKFDDVGIYSVSAVIGSLNPTFLEKDVSPDSVFPKAVALAKEILLREINAARTTIEAKRMVNEAFDMSKDKRLIVLESEINKHAWQSIIEDISDTILFVVHPYLDNWAIHTVRKDRASFENKKDLPEDWAGKSGKELEDATGVEGAIFCHNKRFIATASSKEAILKLTSLALAD